MSIVISLRRTTEEEQNPGGGSNATAWMQTAVKSPQKKKYKLTNQTLCLYFDTELVLRRQFCLDAGIEIVFLYFVCFQCCHND